MIEVSHLVKKYGGFTAVNDISLRMEKGKIYGLLGPNGAGKTTTMNMITGYMGATSGQIVINGHDLEKEPGAAKRCIGYLPEIPPLYMDMTVKEYLKFAAELKGLDKKTRHVDVLQALELTKTKDVSGRLIRNLSKGYRQRVGLAQAVLGLPEIIILDEPTVGLDPKQIIEIRDMIKSLGKKHTVVLSSHILSEVQEICEFVYIISRGKVVAGDTVENLEAQMAGTRELKLQVKACLEDAEKLKDTEGVKCCTLENTSREGVVEVTLVPKPGIDIREAVFYQCASGNLPILEMHTKGNTLEDIFLEVTGEKEGLK